MNKQVIVSFRVAVERTGADYWGKRTLRGLRSNPVETSFAIYIASLIDFGIMVFIKRNNYAGVARMSRMSQ